MKIGILSDTHTKTPGMDGALAVFAAEQIELMLHCGDWTTSAAAAYLYEQAQNLSVPLHGILGNNDRAVGEFMALAAEHDSLQLSEGVLRLRCDDRQIVLYHGHHQPTLRAVLAEDCDLLLLGHSHKPRYDRIVNQREKIILNPGSTAFAIPRSKTWQASVAIYDTVAHDVVFHYFDATAAPPTSTGSV